MPLLLVNFGGPRNLTEVEPFLTELLTDRDVVRTKLPGPINTYLFKRIARRRAKVISQDYDSIGGGSPIFGDTEAVAERLRKEYDGPVLTFHRYIPATHRESLRAIESVIEGEITVFPMFPQFTYATTGSIARFFEENLSRESLTKLRWIKSYPTHKAFVRLFQTLIRDYLIDKGLEDEKTILLFSSHGLPQKFVNEGDLYQSECESSFHRISQAFPKVLSRLVYQSKFGPGEWLRPYTQEVCAQVDTWCDGRENVVFIPLSFTSDHIETLFEVEEEYMPIIREKGLKAYRVPAFNRHPEWVKTILTIAEDFTPVSTKMLIRN